MICLTALQCAESKFRQMGRPAWRRMRCPVLSPGPGKGDCLWLLLWEGFGTCYLSPPALVAWPGKRSGQQMLPVGGMIQFGSSWLSWQCSPVAEGRSYVAVGFCGWSYPRTDLVRKSKSLVQCLMRLVVRQLRIGCRLQKSRRRRRLRCKLSRFPFFGRRGTGQPSLVWNRVVGGSCWIVSPKLLMPVWGHRLFSLGDRPRFLVLWEANPSGWSM